MEYAYNVYEDSYTFRAKPTASLFVMESYMKKQASQCMSL